MASLSEPLVAAPQSSNNWKVTVGVIALCGVLVLCVGLAAQEPSLQHSELVAAKAVFMYLAYKQANCPSDNGGCCLDCEQNQYCPSNQGCYAAGQPGCDVALCPPLAPVHIPVTTAAPPPSRTLRDCSFHECKKAGCDPVVNPFLCVTTAPPAPYMGCSSAPWLEEVCHDACDVGQCSKAKPPADAPTCRVKCPAEFCAKLNSPEAGQRCGADAPFQCLAGSAAMGCSADEFVYVSVADTTCSECCDVSLC